MDHWFELGRAQQFGIALEVARRRGRKLCVQAKAVSVGAGFRSQGSQSAIVDEVCIRFLVARKWADQRNRPRKVKDFVLAYPIIGGRRVRVRIPTDVSEFRGGRPHSNLNLTGGITSTVDGEPLDLGCACCVVRNASEQTERYLLSCYHVFAHRLIRPQDEGLGCTGSDDGTRLGDLFDTAKFTGSLALDAALVRLSDGSVDSVSSWGVIATSRATDFDVGQLPARGPLFVMGRNVAPAIDGLPEVARQDAIAVQFQSVYPHPTSFDYSLTDGRTFEFSDTIEYQGAVRPGDSGAALLDSHGMLYGMHFYGQGDIGYALAAPRLFDPGIFSLGIEL